MVHRVFNSAQYLLVNMHYVVNGGQYVNQMGRSVDYSTYLVNNALESNLCLMFSTELSSVNFDVSLEAFFTCGCCWNCQIRSYRGKNLAD